MPLNFGLYLLLYSNKNANFLAPYFLSIASFCNVMLDILRIWKDINLHTRGTRYCWAWGKDNFETNKLTFFLGTEATYPYFNLSNQNHSGALHSHTVYAISSALKNCNSKLTSLLPAKNKAKAVSAKLLDKRETVIESSIKNAHQIPIEIPIKIPIIQTKIPLKFY